MTSSARPAPFDELASLRARVQQFESQIAERDALLEQRAAAVARHEVTIQQRDARIEQLQEQVRLLLARRFGASSEKLPDGQLGLFNEAEAEAGEEPEAEAGTEVAAHRRAAPKRAPLPDTLERVDIEHELVESERTCPHHGVELERFAEVVSEQLDIVPAKVRVLRHVRGKYRCPSCEGHLRTAPMPAQPLPKSFASPGLLAFIVNREVRRRVAAVSPATTVRAYRGGAVAHDAGAVGGGDGRAGGAVDESAARGAPRAGLCTDGRDHGAGAERAREGAGVEIAAVGDDEPGAGAAHRGVRLRPDPRGRGPPTVAGRVHRRAAHRRLQRLRPGGARIRLGAPGVLGAMVDADSPTC